MMRTSSAVLGLLLVWLALSGGCAPGTADRHVQANADAHVDPLELEGRTWRVVHLDGRALPESVDARPTLEFDGEASRAVGFAGVNQYFAAYERDGASLRFGEVGATRMAGPPEQMELEHAFIAALAAVDAWRIDADGRLELLAADAVRIRLEPAS